MAAPSGVGTAMKFFGKLPGQSLTAFRDEWQAMSELDREQVAAGILDDSLTYTPTAEQVKAARARKIEVPSEISV